jgi:hypothetical protein
MRRLLVAGLIAVLLAPFACAQDESLGDAARRERERKQAAKQAGVATKPAAESSGMDALGEQVGFVGMAMIIDEGFRQGSLTMPTALAKFSAPERSALGDVMMLALVEDECKKSSNKYQTMEAIRAGACEGISVDKDQDPGSRPDYTLSVKPSADTVEIAMQPKHAGLAGFYHDGKTIHAQANAAATAESPALGSVPAILDEVGKAQPKKP